MIREATHEDMEPIVELCLEAHAKAMHSRNVPVHEPTLRKVVLMMIASPSQFSWVVEVDGKVEGVLLGQVNRVWWSAKKEASDLVFYVREHARGRGATLARKFIRWASKRPGVVMVGMSVSFGGESVKRTGKMLQKMGLEHVGGIYLTSKVQP